MMPKLSRRHFLGVSATLLCLPSRLFANENTEDNVVLRAAVMSDVHYSGNPKAAEVERFERACKFMYDYSATQKHPKFDALIVAGDMTNHGTEPELSLFRKSLDKCVKTETRRIICMGNHEFYGGNREYWSKTLDMELLGRTEVNGFTFLTIAPEKGTCRTGDYKYALPWLKKELDAAVSRNNNPRKPIFVIQHYHVLNTVYGSCPPDSWGIIDLHETLCDYPQVINFSGHSHYPIRDPRSAWQGEYSAFGTSTLSYFEMEGGKYDKFPPGHREAAEFYVMEIHRDNSVVLKPYDLRTNRFFDCVYLVTEPGNVNKFIYTDKRFETATAPKWKPGTQITVGEVEPYSARISFPQAVDAENTIHSYRVQMERKLDDGKWQSDGEYYAWSEYYFRDMPTVKEIVVPSLMSEATYRLSVTPINCFKKEGEVIFSEEFTTPKDPDAPTDKDAPNPEANVLNIHFTESGPLNTPKNTREVQKTVETHGKPAFLKDGEKLVAHFNGNSDYLKIPFTEQEYTRLSHAITIGACFKIDEFRDGGGASVFSNTESGGYALEVNMKARKIEFWCHINGRYVIVSAPTETKKYITAYGVYDGSAAILYLDGREVARQAASGKITYTHNSRSRAFCVGADINNAGGGSTFFPGAVAFAKLYSWGLNAKQVENLSKK